MKSFSQFVSQAQSVVFEKKQPKDTRTLREKYLDGDIFKVGEQVEDIKSNKVGEIIRRGANYLICLDESENVFRCWLSENIKTRINK